MRELEDCFLKVKKDYLRLLVKEKIFNKSKEKKVVSLKKIIYQYHSGLKKSTRRKEKLYF